MTLVTRLAAIAVAVAAAIVLPVWHAGGAEPDPAPDPREVRATLEHSARGHDRRAQAGSLVLLGDSISRGLPEGDIPNVTNLGLPGDTSAGMLARLGQYRSLARARAIVVQVGINDLFRRVPPEALAETIRAILARMPAGTPVYVNPVFPIREAALPAAVAGSVDNAAIDRANGLIARTCGPPACRLLDVAAMGDGQGLRAAYDSGDGIHLSKAGYEAWEALLRRGIENASRSP